MSLISFLKSGIDHPDFRDFCRTAEDYKELYGKYTIQEDTRCQASLKEFKNNIRATQTTFYTAHYDQAFSSEIVYNFDKTLNLVFKRDLYDQEKVWNRFYRRSTCCVLGSGLFTMALLGVAVALKSQVAAVACAITALLTCFFYQRQQEAKKFHKEIGSVEIDYKSPQDKIIAERKAFFSNENWRKWRSKEIPITDSTAPWENEYAYCLIWYNSLTEMLGIAPEIDEYKKTRWRHIFLSSLSKYLLEDELLHSGGTIPELKHLKGYLNTIFLIDWKEEFRAKAVYRFKIINENCIEPLHQVFNHLSYQDVGQLMTYEELLLFAKTLHDDLYQTDKPLQGHPSESLKMKLKDRICSDLAQVLSSFSISREQINALGEEMVQQAKA